jgi:hypothetical protein
MAKYKTYVIVDGKPRWVFVNENDVIVNANPSKEELKCVEIRGSQRKRVSYTDEELLNYLEMFCEENGRFPIAKDFVNGSKYPSNTVYQKRFGSWNNALKLAGLDSREKCGRSGKYTDEELLIFLNIFYEEQGKVPSRRDFLNNPHYPDYQNYTTHFGNWGNALKMVGLDVDTMIKKGVLETTQQKGRWVEIIVMDNFENKNKQIDISGKNLNSAIDGICPNGQTYEVKSAKLLTIGKWKGWPFATKNRDKDDDIEAIQWYYFAAFDEDYTKLLYMWRVPGEMVDKNTLVIGMYGGLYTVYNMREYDITDKFKDTIKNKK